MILQLMLDKPDLFDGGGYNDDEHKRDDDARDASLVCKRHIHFVLK